MAGRPTRLSDGVAILQDHASWPPRSALHVDTKPQPLVRSHMRPVTATPVGTKPVPYQLKTDHTREYIPPADMVRKPHIEPGKFDSK